MKVLRLVLLLVLLSVVLARRPRLRNKQDWRLIEFNETYRQWMPMERVLELVEECGKPDQSNPSRHTGFFDVTDHPDLNAENPIPHSPFPTTLRFERDFARLNGSIDPNNIRLNIEALSKFNNRYYTSETGYEAAAFIKKTFEDYIAENKRTDCTVEFFTHSAWKQPSVIATIKGKLAERVIVGGHEDSILSSGMTVNSRAPGADDDASGTSTVLEVFRSLISDPTFKPDRTIEFHTYAAEEVGLRGSQDIASAYKSKGIAVKAMIQFDMTAYKNGKPAVVGDYVSADLTKFLKTLLTKYTSLSWADTTCGYGCSDHASWNKAGYPSCFPFETIFSSSNKKIHTKDDLINILDMDQAREFAALGVGFVLELSK